MSLAGVGLAVAATSLANSFMDHCGMMVKVNWRGPTATKENSANHHRVGGGLTPLLRLMQTALLQRQIPVAALTVAGQG